MFRIAEPSTSPLLLSRNFIEATEQKNYAYYLTKEDILNIARVAYFDKYAISDLRIFKISNTEMEFDRIVREFKDSEHLARLTLIIQFTSGHWGTLVLFRQSLSLGSELKTFYISTSLSSLPTSYATSLQRLNIKIYEWTDEDLGLHSSELISFDVGLQALNFAREFNEVLDSYNEVDGSVSELSSRLSIPPDPYYYISLRNTLTEMLRSEATIRQRHIEHDGELELPPSKHLKMVDKIDVDNRLNHFVKAFIDIMQKKIAAYHVLARGEPLTVEALKQELKICCIGASVGLCVSLGDIKSILPAVIPAIRSNVGHFTVKKKARKITQAFANRDFLTLTPILIDSALELFKSYEAQFMQSTDKGGDVIAMEKLADDAASRIFNYIQQEKNFSDISVESITKGIILGVSERYFVSSISEGFIKFGLPLKDYYGNNIYTADIFQNVGLSFTIDGIERLYDKIIPGQREQYGYRLALNWEKNSQNELIQIYSNKYQQVTEPPLLPYTQPGLQRDLQNYRYSLDLLQIQAKKEALLSQLMTNKPSEILNKAKKRPIFFNLLKPVKNFTGRSEALLKLHNTLLTDKVRISAIVNAMSSLNLEGRESASVSGNSDTFVSLSGLGGVGKTQLALRYASLYAETYDNNVIWINCDTKATLSQSFLRLADKLEIKIKNEYGEIKAIETVAEEVYEYFADQKSLFILDNVENYREIEPFLPKVMVGNKPYVLITSRYQNWENIASTVQLDVFSEEETTTLLKEALNINNNLQDNNIRELHHLLEGLPLALQQAIAYIKVQEIEIKKYVDLYKEESRKLLNFNFREYTNDPYLKTTYTTWQVTLKKIKEEPEIGSLATEIIESISFIAPEELYLQTFTDYYVEITTLKLALTLLRNYSIISEGETSSEYRIHRLLQKVILLSLQEDQHVFSQAVERTYKLLNRYLTDLNISYHYLFFLLNVIENPELESTFGTKEAMSGFAYLLMNYEDGILWNNLFDRIYHRFSKPIFIEFLQITFLTYRKYSYNNSMKILFDYLERKNNEGALSKSEIFKIVDEMRPLDRNPEYKILKFSPKTPRRILQLETVKLIYEFKKTFLRDEYIFGQGSYSCVPKRKRSTLCLINSDTQTKHRQQRLARHLDLLKSIAGFVSTGLFSKDILVDLMHGELKPVAINAGLLLSGRIVGGLSEAMLEKGEKLTAESSLLEELALENKAIPSLSEDVTVLTKKRLLGKMLKTAAPFVKRGTTVYFAFNLYNDIKAYETGDSDRFSGIVSNAGIISIDLIEMGIEGAEILGFFSGVSAVTGPIGEAFIALIWLGAESYEVNKRLSAIEQLTVLTETEKIIQGLRLFFGEGYSPYLDVRIKNNHLVQQGIAFLKNHTGIRRVVFSEAEISGLHDTTKVDLSRLHRLALASTAPDDPKEGQLICAAGVVDPLYGSRIKDSFHACEKAIGIEYAISRTDDSTLITLTKGNDEVYVKRNMPSLFIVEEGYKRYQGSDLNDKFVIKGDRVWGGLSGQQGFDTIDLENYSLSNWTLLDWKGYLCHEKFTRPECNFEYAPLNDIIFLDKINSICKIYSKVPECDLAHSLTRVKLEGIDCIQGRKNKKDIFFLTEDRVMVDGRGGGKLNPDTIYVTNRVRHGKKPQIVLRTNTEVNYRQYLKPNRPFYPVHYLVPSEQPPGEAQVNFPFHSKLIQYLYLEYPLKNLTNIIIENHYIQFDFSLPPFFKFRPKFFSLIMQDGPVSIAPTLHSKHSIRPMRPQWDSQISNTSLAIPTNAYYVFKEGIELKVLDEKHIYARVEQGGSIEEHLNNFIIVANQIGKSFSIQFANNQTAFIGSEQNEVLTTDCLSESYLVGNGGANIYVLSPLNTSTFFLPEVTLYDISAETKYEDLRDTLDLRQVTHKAISICPLQTLSTYLFPTGNDLVLQLTTDSLFDNACQRLNASWPIASVRLKKAFLNKWYQKLDVVYEDHREMEIFYTREKGWFLLDKAFIFEVDKEIIVLTQQELYPHAEFILLKNIGNITFFNHNETDLILTNVPDLNHSPYDLCTIFISQFYSLEELQVKALTATFTFLDNSFILKDYASQITLAANFSDLSKHYPLLTNTRLDHQAKGSPVGHYQKESHAVESVRAKLIDQPMTETSTLTSFLSQAKAMVSAVTAFALTTVMGLSYLFVRRYRHPTLPEVSKNIAVSIPLISQLSNAESISLDKKSEVANEKLVKVTVAKDYQKQNGHHESEILEQRFAGLCESWGSVASLLAMEFKKRREERFIHLDLQRKVALKQIEHMQVKHKLQELVNSFIAFIDQKINNTTRVNSAKLVFWIVSHLMDDVYSQYLNDSISQSELSNKVEIWLKTFIASQNDESMKDRKALLAAAVNSLSFSEFISYLLIDKISQIYRDRPFSEIKELAEKQKLAVLKIMPSILQNEEQLVNSLSVAEGTDFMALAKNSRDKELHEIASKPKQPMKRRYLPKIFNYFKPANLTEIENTLGSKKVMQH